MAKTKGARGPLTLMCRACKRRNIGRDNPIIATGRTKHVRRPRGRWYLAEVACRCGWTFWTNHDSMRSTP